MGKIYYKPKQDLVSFSAHIDAVYYSRKLKPALNLRAAQDHNIDLHVSYRIGDKIQDIAVEDAASCVAILILSPSVIIPYFDYSPIVPGVTFEKLTTVIKAECEWRLM